MHKTATTDDKRLQSTLKRVGVNTIPAIEEVNIFKDDLVIQFLNPKGLLFISFMVSLHTRCLLLLTMWRCRWGLLTCLCPVFCRCSASVHRRKHMGGQWDSPDQEYGSISLLYHLAMMMMMQVVTFLDWIYGCIALMQQLTLIRISPLLYGAG